MNQGSASTLTRKLNLPVAITPIRKVIDLTFTDEGMQSEPHANGTSICHRRTGIDESDIHRTVPAAAREKPGKHGLARRD
jgi:hypothetical protein